MSELSSWVLWTVTASCSPRERGRGISQSLAGCWEGWVILSLADDVHTSYGLETLGTEVWELFQNWLELWGSALLGENSGVGDTHTHIYLESEGLSVKTAGRGVMARTWTAPVDLGLKPGACPDTGQRSPPFSWDSTAPLILISSSYYFISPCLVLIVCMK